MAAMPTSREIVLPWIDLALKLQGHPPCERIVQRGRRRHPRTSWEQLAREVSEKSSGNVTSQFLRLNFGHLDPKPEAVAE